MNHRKEPIVQARRILIACLALLPLLCCSAPEDPSAPTVPPGRSFRWDISKKDSLIEQAFIVAEYRSYSFDIEFHHNGLPDSWWKFIGSGGDSFFTKDPVHPTHVTPEDVGGNPNRLYELWRKGELVIKSADPGVIVPIHIRVDKMDEATGNMTLMADRTADTEALYSGGNGIISRRITAIALKPGRYKVTAVTLKDVPLPPSPNAETYTALGIAYYVNFFPIKE